MKLSKEQIRVKALHKKQVREKQRQVTEKHRQESHEARMQRGRLSSVHKTAIKNERLHQHELRMEQYERKRKIQAAAQATDPDFKRKVETEILAAFREKHRIGSDVELSVDPHTGRIRGRQLLTVGADGVARGNFLDRKTDEVKKEEANVKDSGAGGVDGDGGAGVAVKDGDAAGGGGAIESDAGGKCDEPGKLAEGHQQVGDKASEAPVS